MTTVTTLAGERTIGGTQIVVEDEGARLVFDIGMAYDPAGDPFGHIRRRPWRGLADYIDLGLIPYVPGLYRPESVQAVRKEPDVPPLNGPLAVAVSHSHLDHSHLVGYVRPEVPIHALAPAARVMQVLSDAGSSLGTLDHPIIQVEPGGSFSVGPMTVTMIPVDHDVSGACGMIIQTSDGPIAYSGDIRLHGRHPMWSLAFARAVREAGARLLILEGTRLSPRPEEGSPYRPPPPERVEEDVAPAVAAMLRQHAAGLGLILLTPEHGERVEEVAQAAHAVGRLFVIDLEGLAFATAALGRPLEAPHAVYIPSWMRRALDAGETLPVSFLSALSEAPREVGAAELRAEPSSFLLRLEFESFADLLDIATPGTGGVIIASNGPPLGPFHPAWSTLEWWAARLGMVMADANSTGHAHPHDLALIAAQSGVPTIMSIHSRVPEALDVPTERLLLPERGRRYRVSDFPPPGVLARVPVPAPNLAPAPPPS